MIELISIIESVQLCYTTEEIMQQQLHELFQARSIDAVKEFRLNARDRVDFLAKTMNGNVAVECKTKGSPQTVMAQLARYAESDQVQSVLLVTSRRNHLASEAFREREILGKPLAGVWVAGMR